MVERFSSTVILITAASWAGFAIWLGIRPNALLTGFGIESSTPQIRTEIRAFYGGVELAIAAAMVLLWRQGQLTSSLLVGGLPLAFSATGRCIGMSIDGFSTLHAGFASLEALGAAMCLVAYGRRKSAEDHR